MAAGRRLTAAPPRALLDHAAELLGRVLRFDAAADAVVAAYFRERRVLGARDREALADLVFDVLRERRRFEQLAAEAGGDGTPLRRLAAAAWSEAAALSPAARAALPDALRHNLPDWLADRLRRQLGDAEFVAFADSLLEPAALDLRVNPMRAKRDALRAQLQAAGIDAVATRHSPWGLRVAGKPSLESLDAFGRGDFEVQDEGSQLIALLVDARRGQTVVDFCAGAGGKTLALGAAMRGSGMLIAFDTSAQRLDALKPRLQRSGLRNVYATRIDGVDDPRIARYDGKADRVLVDAPCSGLGTLRRNPDLKWRLTPQTLAALGAQQRAIVQRAAALLKPGGRLVYATCSPLADEDDAVADAFDAAAGARFARLDAGLALRDARVAEAASLVRGADLRLWPHRHGCDAFYAALWQRVG